jgi:uncharacterized protein YukJ
MPIHQYSVLKATPQSGELSHDSKPHYLITCSAGGSSWQIAVNIESADGSEVLYRLDENFIPPDPTALEQLAVGATPLAGLDTNPAIDYVRSTVNTSPLITREQMMPLPLPGRDGSETLKNAVVQFLNEASKDAGATVYAFGSLYDDGTNGIHDIHMNQGNPPNDHEQDNGVWQDGLLLFSLPGTSSYTAVFIAFQDESWDTDENGNPA